MDATAAEKRPLAAVPVVYGLLHALVDLTTIYALARARVLGHVTGEAGFALLLAYDGIAFATQPLVGWIVDAALRARLATVLGLALAALGLALAPVDPWAAVIAATIGNALFHVGGGALALTARPGRATAAGLFVAPGALGLAAGRFLAKGGLPAWPIFAALAAGIALAAFVAVPGAPPRAERVLRPIRRAGWILLLLLGSIVVRSFVGRAGGYLCPRLAEVAVGFAVAGFAGKALGGIAADRWGWIAVGVGASLLAAPLVAFGGGNVLPITLGLLLVQATTAITLAATAALLPGRPATAFGLTALAYIVGFAPNLFPAARVAYGPTTFLVLLLLAAGALYAALRGLRDEVPTRFSGE